MNRIWRPTSRSNYSDLKEVPRWQTGSFLFATVVLSAVGVSVLAFVGLYILIDKGHHIPVIAWGLPISIVTAFGALAAMIRRIERPSQRDTSEKKRE